jgi:hypothetical protein
MTKIYSEAVVVQLDFLELYRLMVMEGPLISFLSCYKLTLVIRLLEFLNLEVNLL